MQLKNNPIDRKRISFRTFSFLFEQSFTFTFNTIYSKNMDYVAFSFISSTFIQSKNSIIPGALTF